MCAQIFMEQNCTIHSHLDTMWKPAYCKSSIFTESIFVDEFAFETALVNAAMHVGARLKLRGVEPVRDPSTPTGWK